MKKTTTGRRQLVIMLTMASILTACDADDVSQRAVGELTSDRIELVVESNEPIVDIPFAEGQWVQQGQVLLVQDSARVAAQLQEAQAALAQTQARLAELVRGPRGEQIAATRAALEGASQELSFRGTEQARIEELHARALASRDTLDKANAALDAARADFAVRRAQLQEQLAGTTIEELRQAEEATKQAAARLQLVDIDLRRLSLRAPADGLLDSRLFEIGERPAVGQTAMVLLGGTQVFARVYVPEYLRAGISAGSKVSIYVDGVDGALSGRVRWISSEAAFTPYYALTERDRGRLSYVAKIDITDDRPRLPDGVPVEVEFQLD